MATTIQLKDFTAKTSPVPSDLLYLGDSANSFDEAKSTIAQVVSAYPNLSSIAGLTTAANQMIYTTGVSTFATSSITAFGLATIALAAINNGVLITNNTGTASLLSNGTAGFVLTANSGAPPSWQSASASGAITSLAGNSGSATPSAGVVTVSGGTTGLTTSGAASTLTLTGTLVLANGGLGASIVASNGGIFYSTGSAGALLSGTATARQMLQSGASAAPTWSTSVWPATTTANQLLYSSATNTVIGLSTAASSVLITDSGGVPSLGTTLPSGLSATNMNLTTPRMAVIDDTNGNAILTFSATGSAVNSLVIENNITGNAPTLTAVGSDTDIGLTFSAKAAGGFTFTTTASSSAVVFNTGTASQHVTSFTFPNTSANRSIAWPDASGTILLSAASGGLKSFQVLTSGTAATYTTPAGITSILVQAIGGGGGGGGIAITTGGGAAAGGGGGAAFVQLYIATAAATYTYTVGAGGVGGAAGNNNGGNATATTFVGTGVNISAGGGLGGAGSPKVTVASIGGTGGGANGSSGGDLNLLGNVGGAGFITGAAGGGVSIGGAGGGTVYGSQVPAVPASFAGQNANPNTGCGGSGAATFNDASAYGGGNGASGLIIVWEFA